MKSSTFKYIESAFKKELSKANKFKVLITRLEQLNWVSQLEKQSSVAKLAKLSKNAEPILNEREDLKQIESTIYECFYESYNSTLTRLLKSNSFPPGFKLLVIEEYLKFYSRIDEDYATKDAKFRFTVPRNSYLHSDGVVFFLNSQLDTSKSRKIFDSLMTNRSKLIEKNKGKNFWDNEGEKKADINITKAILNDLFFQKHFKFMVKDVLSASLRLEKEKLNINFKDYHDLLQEKYFFNSTYQKNTSFLRYKYQLLFAYFFILEKVCKSENTDLRMAYSHQILTLTIRLFESNYDKRDIPVAMSTEKLKSILKDF